MIEENLARKLGPGGWLRGEDVLGYSRDWLDRYGVPPVGVARPVDTQEVIAVVRACREAGVAIVPQGGNTGLCGGAVCADTTAVIMSLSRMSRIGDPDPASGSVEVEAGVVLAALHEAVNSQGLIFPLHLGAEGSAQIGGLIGTNAGGSHALRYGMMQDLVLGLEVVMADGRVWDGMRSVQKDNAGYQLRRLFCGAEGTLGIVTRTMLKLYPAPHRRVTALLAAPTLNSLVTMGARLRAETGEFLSALEFFSDFGLELAQRHVRGLVHPLESRAPWYLLMELEAGSDLVPLRQMLEKLLEAGLESGDFADGTLAMSEAQRRELWGLREAQPEGQRLEGAQLKHDISVPPGRLAEFARHADLLCEEMLPGMRINLFGHLGDGNIHYNLSPPADDSGFGDVAPELAFRLGGLAGSVGGSFAAEHGLGRSKIALADGLRSDVERKLMRRLKNSLDPDRILNPGVIVG